MLKYAGDESLFSRLEYPVISNMNLVAICNLFKSNVLIVFFVYLSITKLIMCVPKSNTRDIRTRSG